MPVENTHRELLVYQKVADRTVKKVFAILGVDIDRPESVEEFREDLRFGRKLRKAADHGFLILVGVAVVAGMTAIGAGIVSKISAGQ